MPSIYTHSHLTDVEVIAHLENDENILVREMCYRLDRLIGRIDTDKSNVEKQEDRIEELSDTLYEIRQIVNNVNF